MSNFFISTDAIFSPTRNAVAGLQTTLARVQKEISTGKVADAGLEIGTGFSELGKLRQTQAYQDALTGTNAIAATRLDTSQTALTTIGDTAQSFIDQLLAQQSASPNPAGLIASAKSGLSGLTEQLNSEVAGVHVFGGDNSGSVPLASFSAPGSAASQAITTAFTTAFGFAPGDPQEANITPAQIQAFIDGPLAAQFSDSNWLANWSKASSQNPTARISEDQDIEVGANANEQPFRQLAQAYVLVSALGVDKLSPSALKVVTDSASNLANNGRFGVIGVVARLGTAQQQVTSANDQLAAQGQIITNRLNKLENADPYAAATTANTLATQLQASYAVTARIQQLSIVKYI